MPKSKSHSTPGVKPGHGENLCHINELENRGGGGWTREDRGGEEPVTEIIDRRQRAVMPARELLLQGLGFLGMQGVVHGDHHVVAELQMDKTWHHRQLETDGEIAHEN